MRKWQYFGDGVVDFKAIADTLKAVGFEGCVTTEQDRKPEVKASCGRYLQAMRQYLA